MLTDADIIETKDGKFKIKGYYKTFNNYDEAKREINRFNAIAQNIIEMYYEKKRKNNLCTIDDVEDEKEIDIVNRIIIDSTIEKQIAQYDAEQRILFLKEHDNLTYFFH